MSSAAVIAGALARAEVHRLPPTGRAYLTRRLQAQIAGGDIEPARNLGGLRNIAFGSTGAGEATFADLDSAARALVAVSYRAAPRAWGNVNAAELAQLGRYPFNAERQAKRLAELAGQAPPELGWWPGFGPSEAAEATFRGLMADHAAFDRIGVGGRVFGPDDPDKRHANLAEDVTAWRAFRDAWLAGDIPSTEIGGQLTAQVIGANKIRQYLAEAKITDPELQTELRKGVAVDEATNAAAPATKIDTWARSVPVLRWLTDPGQTPANATKRILAVAGASVAVLAGVVLVTRSKGHTTDPGSA